MAIAVHPGTEEQGAPPAGPPTPPPPPRGKGRGVGDKSPLGLSWGLVLPSIIVVAVVSIFPIVYAVNLSLHETSYMQIGEFIGLQHFIWIFTSAEGQAQIARSLIYVVGSLVIAVPLSLALANLLNQNVRFRRVFRVLILMPWVISQTVAALLWKWLVNPDYGPLGLGETPFGRIDFLADPVLAMTLLIVVNVWISYPLATILCLASLQTIPEELREAAEVDGAGPFRRFMQVTLPLMKPTLFVVAIQLTLLYFNMVTLVYTLTGGGPLDGTNLLSLAAFKQSFEFFNLGLGAAYSVVLFAFNVLFGAAYIRLLRSERNG
ncbi:carbohydrate ABC transporter permease [Microbacterium sp. UBA3394]|uniref:carbohydrate ABC transporter permease n=1 Tax=Microbacterium sp. UBA3394 TaxID=1946945 RepID=UPI000C63013D|nr:sugar ABC transporter permease [Microbacterium sp. UBA3394]MAB81760.1 sugar ABC transporter permease [Planctomycetota bacterium]MAM53335.1 sugar ABC transporter permease [Microbacterium sp.]|tara:strand:- start:4502 stop:5461 length:960 start_codon:yes stop_codon:yes gene_type:complete